MKRILVFTLLSFAFLLSFAQDTITFFNGRLETVKVEEISNSEIRYKRFSNLEGPTIIVPKEEVAQIKYKNGEIDSFQQTEQVVLLPPPAAYPAPSYLRYSNNSPSYLTLNNMYISSEQAYSELGNRYDDFLCNRAKYKVGKRLWIAGLGTAFVVSPILFGVGEHHEVFPLCTVAVFTTLSSVAMISTGATMHKKYKKRMHGVIREYNNRQYYSDAPSDAPHLDFGISTNGAAMRLTF